MSELERLRADLEVFERYAERQPALRHECDQITREIARLEAEADDPWREHNDLIARWRRTPPVDACKKVVEYVDHLTAENAGLKQKYDLANSTIEIATKRLNEVKAENDRLTKLVAKLEAELQAKTVVVAGAAIGKSFADQTDEPPPVNELDPILDPARPKFEIAGTRTVKYTLGEPLKPRDVLDEVAEQTDDPVLDPARVLATADELWARTTSMSQEIRQRLLEAKRTAKPYPLKGANSDGE